MVPAVSGLVAFGLLIAVVAVAYGTQAPGLAVAEFSPAARQAMAPPPTTADLAAGGAGAARRRATTTTTAPVVTDLAATATSSAAPTTRVARARACVGNPPRQIADPMSPPCLNTIFEGDNGGATSGGVSSTEIRVGVPVRPSFVNGMTGYDKPVREAILGMFEFVNQRFELYGRRLVPVLVSGGSSDAMTSRTIGANVVAEGVFAALTAGEEMDSRNPQAALVQELGRAGVVTMVRGAASWWSDRTMFDAYHPYVWSVYPSSEQLQRNLGALACQLAGKPASHRPDGGPGSPTRRFGLVVAARQVAPNVGVLSQAIEACAGTPPALLSLAPFDSNALRTGANKFAADGITTAICVCEGTNYSSVLGGAHASGFDPEWIMTPTNSWGLEADFQGTIRGGTPPPILLESGPRLLPMQARPWVEAILATGSQRLTGGALDQQYVAAAAEFFYAQILMLASGIQSAGPNLTPGTFATALMATAFPNPGAGQAPYWQPSVRFGPGDHAFYDDYAVGWWSPEATILDPYAGFPTGSWCFVQQGARFSATSFPADIDRRLYNRDVPCR